VLSEGSDRKENVLKQLLRLVAAFGLMLVVAAQAQGGKPQDKSTCSASCLGGVTLTVNCSGSCSAVDANCPSTNGYVLCNGVKTSCSSTCPVTPPPCESLNGTACSPRGATTSCTGSDGLVYTCNCFGTVSNPQWICPI
jgi:hypothetical protein